MGFLTYLPTSGDTDNILLQKVVQILAAGGGVLTMGFLKVLPTSGDTDNVLLQKIVQILAGPTGMGGGVFIASTGGSGTNLTLAGTTVFSGCVGSNLSFCPDNIWNVGTAGARPKDILVGGKIGIGTSTPSDSLDIATASVGTGIRLKGVLPNIAFFDSANVFGGSLALGTDPGGILRGFVIQAAGVTGNLGVSDCWQTYRFNGGNNKVYIGDTGTVSWIQGGHQIQIAANRAGVPSTAVAPDLTIDSGSLTVRVNTRINGNLIVPTGANARAGNAVLVAGTVTVANTSVTANTVIMITRKTIGGVVGNTSYTVAAGASFTINSSVGTDTSTMSYFLIENP